MTAGTLMCQTIRPCSSPPITPAPCARNGTYP